MKPNDPQWEKDVSRMMQALTKLSPDELLLLFRLIDADPPAGKFYRELGNKVVGLFPEEFKDDEKEGDDDATPVV